MNLPGAGAADESMTEMWIVDRVHDRVAILVEATEEDDPAVIEVAVTLLGPHADEGAVLIVPLGDVGEPVWDRARRVEG